MYGVILGLGELLINHYFVGGAKFTFSQGFGQLSYVFSYVCKVFPEVQHRVDVDAQHFVGFVGRDIFNVCSVWEGDYVNLFFKGP